MIEAALGRFGRILVAALLATQLLLLWLSLGSLDRISIFCTGPRSSVVGGAFGILHLLFLGLALLGGISLRVAQLRLLYAVLLLMGFAALPLQASLVADGTLRCDGP